MASLEYQLRSVLKEHGFETASIELEIHPKQRRNLPQMIASWNNYPECMNIYPETLSKKDATYLKGF